MEETKPSAGAVEFARKLRHEEIPGKGYQHRGVPEWYRGVAVAIDALVADAEKAAWNAALESAVRWADTPEMVAGIRALKKE